MYTSFTHLHLWLQQSIFEMVIFYYGVVFNFRFRCALLVYWLLRRHVLHVFKYMSKYKKYVRVRIWMCRHASAHTHTYTRTHTHTHTHTLTHIHVHLQKLWRHTWEFIRHLCWAYIYVNMYIYINIYIHIDIHISIFSTSCKWRISCCNLSTRPSQAVSLFLNFSAFAMEASSSISLQSY